MRTESTLCRAAVTPPTRPGPDATPPATDREAELRALMTMAAHDLTDQHRSLLSNGSFAYLLTQDIHYCVGAAARVLRALCENVRGALNVVQPRGEILTAENLQ